MTSFPECLRSLLAAAFILSVVSVLASPLDDPMTALAKETAADMDRLADDAVRADVIEAFLAEPFAPHAWSLVGSVGSSPATPMEERLVIIADALLLAREERASGGAADGWQHRRDILRKIRPEDAVTLSAFNVAAAHPGDFAPLGDLLWIEFLDAVGRVGDYAPTTHDGRPTGGHDWSEQIANTGGLAALGALGAVEFAARADQAMLDDPDAVPAIAAAAIGAAKRLPARPTVMLVDTVAGSSEDHRQRLMEMPTEPSFQWFVDLAERSLASPDAGLRQDAVGFLQQLVLTPEWHSEDGPELSDRRAAIRARIEANPEIPELDREHLLSLLALYDEFEARHRAMVQEAKDQGNWPPAPPDPSLLPEGSPPVQPAP